MEGNLMNINWVLLLPFWGFERNNKKSNWWLWILRIFDEASRLFLALQMASNLRLAVFLMNFMLSFIGFENGTDDN
jgi:hypothetical protein